MCASEDVLLNSFQNTERKRRLFEGRFTRGKYMYQKGRFRSPLVRRLVPFIRMREAMWL
jgi:hypothetical protein